MTFVFEFRFLETKLSFLKWGSNVSNNIGNFLITLELVSNLMLYFEHEPCTFNHEASTVDSDRRVFVVPLNYLKLIILYRYLIT